MLSRTPSVPILLGLVLMGLVAGVQPQKGRDVNSLSSAPARHVARAGYVLAASDGEVIRRKGNTVTVKVDPKTGSPGMAMGTQALEPGVGIPVHMHEHEDEVLFIHGGRGVAVLGEKKKEVGQGDTVFIPHGVWHGVESRGEAIDLLWIVTPPGLEGFFRETGVPPGAPPKVLTPAQLEDIGRKHGVRFKH
ncbi:MAG TPA: cupin domain-containing protein [Pyrinomonadaceae bacterium]|nr:cupin domain-containing protein [Pyrinomonadaceae bacterium]